MANCIVTYIAQRRLRAGVVAGDQVVLPLSVTQCERSTQTKENSIETLSGRTVTSLYSIRDQYEVATGIIPPELQPLLDEFAYSVLAGEEFTLTNPDEADREMTGKLVGRVRRSRPAKTPLNQFRYSFTFREVE